MTRHVAEALAPLLYHLVLEGLGDSENVDIQAARLKSAVTRANYTLPNPTDGGGFKLEVDRRRLTHALDKCPIVVVDPDGSREL
jgi:hypothetical protein